MLCLLPSPRPLAWAAMFEPFGLNCNTKRGRDAQELSIASPELKTNRRPRPNCCWTTTQTSCSGLPKEKELAFCLSSPGTSKPRSLGAFGLIRTCTSPGTSVRLWVNLRSWASCPSDHKRWAVANGYELRLSSCSWEFWNPGDARPVSPNGLWQ